MTALQGTHLTRPLMSSGTWHGAGEEGTVCAECRQTLSNGTCTLGKDGMAINKVAEVKLFVLWSRAGRWWGLKGDGRGW